MRAKEPARGAEAPRGSPGRDAMPSSSLGLQGAPSEKRSFRKGVTQQHLEAVVVECPGCRAELKPGAEEQFPDFSTVLTSDLLLVTPFG